MNPNKSDQRKLEIVPIKLAISTGFGFPSNTTVRALGHISPRPETIFEDMPLERSIMRMSYYLPKSALYSVTIVMQCGSLWIVYTDSNLVN